VRVGIALRYFTFLSTYSDTERVPPCSSVEGINNWDSALFF